MNLHFNLINSWVQQDGEIFLIHDANVISITIFVGESEWTGQTLENILNEGLELSEGQFLLGF